MHNELEMSSLAGFLAMCMQLATAYDAPCEVHIGIGALHQLL
jgi:hypothetical protein